MIIMKYHWNIYVYTYLLVAFNFNYGKMWMLSYFLYLKNGNFYQRNLGSLMMFARQWLGSHCLGLQPAMTCVQCDVLRGACPGD